MKVYLKTPRSRRRAAHAHGQQPKIPTEEKRKWKEEEDENPRINLGYTAAGYRAEPAKIKIKINRTAI